MTKKSPWDFVIPLPYLGEAKRLKAQPCLKCGQMQDAATGLDNNKSPWPGAAAVCLMCGHIMIYDEDLNYREATTEERNIVANTPSVKIVLEYIRTKNRKSPWQK